jgi:hypothetical protein
MPPERLIHKPAVPRWGHAIVVFDLDSRDRPSV